MFKVFGDCLNTAKGFQGSLNTMFGHSVFGEKERPTLKWRSPYVRGVWRLPETAKGVQGTVNTKYGHSVFGEIERPFLKEISPYV